MRIALNNRYGSTAIIWFLLIAFCGHRGWSNGIADFRIRNAVDDVLDDSDAVPATFVDVSVRDGAVNLEGTVWNALAKDRAEQLAGTVKGVKWVDNDIEIITPFRSDSALKEDVDDALAWDAAMDSYGISASVTDGMVKLEGTVNSRAARELAARVVKSVRGVKGVDNHIAVQYTAPRTDSQIRGEVEKALQWDAYVDSSLVNVSVDEGKVSMEGTVGSLAEKERISDMAWVPGVTVVDTSGLNVDWEARSKRPGERKPDNRTDVEVKNAIVRRLRRDPWVTSFDVNVDVVNGYVTLRGVVDNLKAKRQAGQAARDIVGVWSVSNRIKVRPSTPEDARVEDRVEKTLARSPFLNKREIDVTVTHGVVRLRGDVDTNREKAIADDLAARIYGVREVKNALKVDAEETVAYDPYTDEWTPEDFDWYKQPTRRSRREDLRIWHDISRELYWSPHVDSRQIKVRVEDGVARLEGEVSNWQERQIAEQNALQGGAVAVDNELSVKFGPSGVEGQ